MTLEPTTDNSVGPSLFSSPASGAVVDNTATQAGSTSLDNTPANNQPAASAPAAGPGSMTVAEWKSLPKAWKAELAADWESLSPKVQEYIHNREGQVTDGIRRYAQSARAWNDAIEPLAPVLQQNPNVNPVELYRSLAANHLALVQAAPEARREMFLQMAQHYGVDFAQAAAGQPGQQAASGDFTPQQLRRLQQMLSPILSPVQEIIKSQQAATLTEMNKAVDAFFSDPQNEFADKVSEQMIEIFKSGQAKDLKTAYELACLRNPDVKPAYLKKQFDAANQTRLPTVQNVKSSTSSVSPGKPASIDDTFKTVLAKHFPS